MKYAIFSDTHANLAALEAVMRAVEAEKVDAMVCLGDTVGYGPQPNECCEIVRNVAKYTILGNHDAAVAGRMDYSYYYDAARGALDHHASIITEENMEWLKSLPYMVRDDDVQFCHGSPVDLEEFEYIFSVEQAETCLPIWPDLGRLTLIGHSHLCKSFAIHPERAYEVVTHDYEIREGFRYVASVGSVGQPRDHDPRACFVVLDTDAWTLRFVRVEYDIETTASQIFATSGLADSFGARLFAGV
jgi:diadenosine tetraphosphatase ApaH/serine/threonine PP2A family protein phosphatase